MQSFDIYQDNRTKKNYVGWQRCNVYEDLEIPRCYNYQEFFHKKTACSNKMVCPDCGEEHEHTQCNNNAKCCRNCCISNNKYKTKYNTNHSAADPECPAMLYHINNLKGKTLYHE